MGKYSTKKVLFFTSALLLTSQAFALRCGNKIINIGDTYHKIMSHCSVDREYVVQNSLADIRNIYINRAGMTYQLTVVDGILKGMTYGRM